MLEVEHPWPLFLLETITMPVAVRPAAAPGGITNYYRAKNEDAELKINRKTQNLRRLEAQRNALNTRGMISFSALRVKE